MVHRERTASHRPNILFIMADDHAARAIGCYGSGLNATPAIDRIADGGVRLDHCYVTNSICTPSRAAILTGTYNHVNGVTTLRTPLDNRFPNVAKHLQRGGYQTAIVGKWHLGEGPAHAPAGFDHHAVLPGQGAYFDPEMIVNGTRTATSGYVSDVITDGCLDWLEHRDPDRPFFLMCHHKAPHRPWDPHPKNRDLYRDDVPVPPSFDDDYRNRGSAAAEARIRVRDDLTYRDLGLVTLDIGEPTGKTGADRKVPTPEDLSRFRLTDSDSGEVFTFVDHHELALFKYQRYLKRYLRTVASLDESVGRLLDYLDDAGIADDTLVVYTSDQGFFLGEHGWFDKRFMYEQSFQMPFVARLPGEIEPGSASRDFARNVDFAPTFLDYAGLQVPTYMQGRSLRPILTGDTPSDWSQLAYHRYWMHCDATHNIRAHYGVRDHRYKLIYWYNEGYGLPGTNGGGQEREWELFDLDEDPLELVNVHDDPAYAEVRADMLRKLDATMLEIGDVSEHPA